MTRIVKRKTRSYRELPVTPAPRYTPAPPRYTPAPARYTPAPQAFYYTTQTVTIANTRAANSSGMWYWTSGAGQ